MRPPTRRPTRPAPSIVAAVAGAVATAAVLVGPALGPGYALYLDHVAVPDPARPQWQDLGAPSGLRAWPVSGVTWAWSQLLPTWTFQHLVLVAAVLGAGLGVGMVLRLQGRVVAFSGAVLAIANPYVVERLLLGQASLLLAYAALPWIVLASRQPTPRRRVGLVTLASVPAALTPWGALVAGMGAVSVALIRRRSGGEVASQALASGALCLPWLVPALLMRPGPADPQGAYAFRLADDVGLGTLGSALAGGGVWSSAAQLSARQGAVGVTSTVVIVTLAALGAWSVTRARPLVGTVVVATWLGIPLATALLSGPALPLWADLQTAPGMALFRDLHRLLAPSVVALVLLAAVGTRRLVSATAQGQRAATAALGVVLPVSLAVMLVPGGPARLHSAYEPGPFSQEWARAVAATGDTGRVLSLPWQPLRQTAWMPYPFLDPTGNSMGVRAVTDPTLTVVRDGRSITVRDPARSPGQGDLDDTLVRHLTRTSGDPVPSELLASSRIQHVLVWKDSPGPMSGRPSEWTVTFSGADFEVWSDEGVASR
jgi:hypothetical protein